MCYRSLLKKSVCLLLFCGACTNSEPKQMLQKAETLEKRIPEKEPINTQSIQPPINFPIYDGTIETARKQVNEILNAIKTKRLSAYTYLYDNDSGGDHLAGLLFFSLDDGLGKGREWCLRLLSNYYYLDYFFDANLRLFAIKQWEIESEQKTVAEIFYKKDGSIMPGSWLKRASEIVPDLSTYSTDYWYDFFEGYPFYETISDMKKDKRLMYQQ